MEECDALDDERHDRRCRLINDDFEAENWLDKIVGYCGKLEIIYIILYCIASGGLRSCMMQRRYDVITSSDSNIPPMQNATLISTREIV